MAQWLACPPAPLDLDAEHAALTLLALELEQGNRLASPSAALLDALAPTLQEIPRQNAGPRVADTDPFWKWLDVAAVIEFRGDPALAHVVMQRLLLLCTAGRDPSDPVSRVYRGLCCARLGRIARTVGQGDDARAWYTDAIRLGQDAAASDPLYQGMLGMATTAIAAGNFPQAERWLRLLLRGGDAVPAMYRLPAHQQLAMTSRKRGRWVDALLESWAAYDLLEPADPREVSLRVTLAEIACELGAYAEAAHAVSPVLAVHAPTHVLAPAYIVALKIARFAPVHLDEEATTSADVRAAAERILNTRIAPTDETALRLALADTYEALGEPMTARRHLSEALVLAERHHLHERSFAITARLRASATLTPPPTAPTRPTDGAINAQRVEQSKASRRHPAVRRLLHL
ncbi:hypothetical protein [Gemmatimonas sp.]|uniref:tetratricopeptide repeat protein n=1 Tax=Gemmatimonas sp. TaxID=1962908 RepID=UPI00333FCC8E